MLENILRAIRAAVKIPFTIKLRSGWSDEEIVALQVARLAEDCGVEALAIHPRTRVQGFSGRARWEIIQQVKQAVRIPVIGNGDVFKPQDALALQRTDRLRRGDDRARGRLQSLDLPPNGGILRHGRVPRAR